MLAGAAIAIYQYGAGHGLPVRHVIIISLDTTRADHFGCYGNTWISTPRIDALASESILFTNYRTVVPTTLASHTSLFTGKYPHTHGTPRNGFVVNDDNVMLAEILKEAGFHAAGFLGSFALDSRFNFAQGFDHYDETFDQLVGERGADQNQRSAEAVTDTVIAHLDENGIPPRSMLFVHYFDPHAPYSPPADYVRSYDPEAVDGPPHNAAVRRWLAQTPGQVNELARMLGARYAGEITYMDEHIGRLLDALDERGILDEAILVVVSDHGEDLWDHPQYFNHGLTTYQSSMHAVCMVRMPKAASGGSRIDDLVGSIDVLPTILNYLGLSIPKGIDGEAVDLIQGVVPSSPRTRFGEATKPWNKVETDPRWYNNLKARCVWEGSLKYIRVPYNGSEALYDLAADPNERNNLLTSPSPQARASAKTLRHKLEAWTNSARPLPSTFQPSQRDETIRRLKSLGYLGGSPSGGKVGEEP